MYIDEALALGYDVEIDFWLKNNVYYLGHDAPTYRIKRSWILTRKNKLWIHCKNIEAANCLINVRNGLNFFCHDKDDYVLTSKQYLWVYPGKQLIEGCVAVLPEKAKNLDLSKAEYICTDDINKYEKLLNSDE